MGLRWSRLPVLVVKKKTQTLFRNMDVIYATVSLIHTRLSAAIIRTSCSDPSHVKAGGRNMISCRVGHLHGSGFQPRGPLVIVQCM